MRDPTELVKLLEREPQDTRSDRYGEFMDEVAAELSNSAYLLQVIRAAIDGFHEDTTAVMDLVSFLSEDDLAQLVRLVERGAVDDGLRSHVMLQAPALFPATEIDAELDFADREPGGQPYQGKSWHLVFEEGARPSIDFETQRRHPTWHLPPEGDTVAFGGPGSGPCPACGAQLTHLLTFENFPPGLPARGRVRFETCPDALEAMWFKHDADGNPTPTSEPHRCYGGEGEYASILASTTARLALTPPRWTRQNWGFSNSRQNLTKLGGLPSWVQDPDYPLVPGTDRPMEFLMQIDSFFPAAREGSEIMWGSGGVLYIFWDEQSRISCTMQQCT